MNLRDRDFEKLALISQGHSAFQILWAGVELGVFEFLDLHPDATEAEIASGVMIDGKPASLQAQPARILLRGLSALGLTKFSKGKYRNSAATKKYLVKKSPSNSIDVLGWQRFIVYPGVTDFLESLEKNTNVGLRHFPGTENALYPRLARDPKLEEIFHKAMSALSRTNNKNLVSHIDISSVRHLVDAGGGAATNALALVKKNKKLRVTIFDIPTVCKQANAVIAKSEYADRVGTHSGNLFSDPFPQGIDAILFGHLLTIWSPEKNIELLKRAYDALPRGGRVFVFNMMANDDGTGPISCALGSVYFMAIATGTGMLYSWNDQMDFLKKAGFKKIKKQVLPNAHGIIVGYK